MPLAIKAIESYGCGHAFPHVHVLTNLAQTEATVEWTIRELHREEDNAQDYEGYFHALSQLLCSADTRLLIARADEILQTPAFSQELVSEFQERLQLASWEADQCWKELESICEDAAKDDDLDLDFGHASRVVEALAPQGETYIERILNLLGKELQQFETNPMTWLEIFLVE